MTKASDRIFEMLQHVLPQNPKPDELVLLLTYEDHVRHEEELRKEGLPIFALDSLFGRSGLDVVTFYGGKTPTMVIKKSGLLWMAQESLGHVVANAKRSKAVFNDPRDPAQQLVVAYNDIVLARGNRIGPAGEVLVG